MTEQQHLTDDETVQVEVTYRDGTVSGSILKQRDDEIHNLTACIIDNALAVT